MKHGSILILTMALLSGCATAYQRESFTGGYSQTQLGDNIFQVSFKGNGCTSEDRASDYTLLRSAEITLENGFKYFTIVESEKNPSLAAIQPHQQPKRPAMGTMHKQLFMTEKPTSYLSQESTTPLFASKKNRNLPGSYLMRSSS